MSWLKFNNSFECARWQNADMDKLQYNYHVACERLDHHRDMWVDAREIAYVYPTDTGSALFAKATERTYREALKRKLRCIEEIAAKQMEGATQ